MLKFVKNFFRMVDYSMKQRKSLELLTTKWSYVLIREPSVETSLVYDKNFYVKQCMRKIGDNEIEIVRKSDYDTPNYILKNFIKDNDSNLFLGKHIVAVNLIIEFNYNGEWCCRTFKNNTVSWETTYGIMDAIIMDAIFLKGYPKLYTQSRRFFDFPLGTKYHRGANTEKI